VNESVLLVEDDPSVRESATMLLERSGLRVKSVEDGGRAIEAFQREPFDLVLLDVMLPSVDGFDVCRTIRQRSQVPIVMLTARTDVTDVVAGLELGADDYVTKPFRGPELVARVRAALRRTSPQEGSSGVLRVHDLEIDLAGFRVSKAGSPVELSATEFKLLAELAQASGRVLSREILLERVWGYDYLGDSRLVDMAVKRLRDKLGDDSRESTYVSTVRGVGYRFEPE
jgi:two-component system response regulator MtrA